MSVQSLMLSQKMSSGGDPYWANVLSLLHFDGANGSTTFTDEKGVSWTRYGSTAAISTAQSKFGGSSLLLSSGGLNGTYASALGTGDYTIECWIYPTSVSAITVVWGKSNYALDLWNNQLLFYRSAQYCISAAITANNWYHVALVRESGVNKIYVNGVASATTTTAGSGDPGAAFDIGCLLGGNTLQGYIDEFRVTKDVARYTSNFTPPTAPFPNF